MGGGGGGMDMMGEMQKRQRERAAREAAQMQATNEKCILENKKKRYHRQALPERPALYICILT
jgi:hypothetical protein